MRFRTSENVQIGGFSISGVREGADWTVGDLQGWWDRPGVKRTDTSREMGDGDYPAPWRFDARYITIPGRVRARDHDHMHAIMDRLGSLAAFRRETLSVQGHGPVQSALVQADDPPAFTMLNDRILDFTLFFKATDPCRYGQERSVELRSAFTDVPQIGNYLAYPSITVRPVNARGGFRLVTESAGEQRVWEYLFSGTTSETHRMDLASGRHFVSGVEQPNRLGSAAFWPLTATPTVRARIEPIRGGSVTATATYRDTWI